MVKSKENLVGAWAFLIGVILAVIIGLFQSSLASFRTPLFLALVILGLLVGFLNVGDKDSMSFLLASVSLVVVSGLGRDSLLFISNLSPILGSLSEILSALLILFVPATVIVVLKTIFSIAKV